jgi:uncharacterized protein (DUF2126 family)
MGAKCRRSCAEARMISGRHNYVGGLNHLVSLTMLDDIDALSDRIRRIAPDLRGAEAA